MDLGLQLQPGVVAALLVVLWLLPDWERHVRRARRWGRPAPTGTSSASGSSGC